jgi:hypothetical protein
MLALRPWLGRHVLQKCSVVVTAGLIVVYDTFVVGWLVCRQTDRQTGRQAGSMLQLIRIGDDCTSSSTGSCSMHKRRIPYGNIYSSDAEMLESRYLQ